jgi:hypothetical protein
MGGHCEHLRIRDVRPSRVRADGLPEIAGSAGSPKIVLVQAGDPIEAASCDTDIAGAGNTPILGQSDKRGYYWMVPSDGQ